jgi:hypothetical protein
MRGLDSRRRAIHIQAQATTASAAAAATTRRAALAALELLAVSR